MVFADEPVSLYARFPLKKNTDTKALSDQLAPMLSALFKVTVDIPVDDYSSTRLANLGLGHGAIDGGAGPQRISSTHSRVASDAPTAKPFSPTSFMVRTLSPGRLRA